MEAAQSPDRISAEELRQQIAPRGYFFKENLYLSIERLYDNVTQASNLIRQYEKQLGDRLHVSASAYSDSGTPLALGEAVAIYVKPVEVVRPVGLLSPAGVTIEG